MSGCCHDETCDATVPVRQRGTLKTVLGINLGMFGVEFAAGLLAASTALLADSLDMLGDALVYGFSLYVVGRGERWLATSALLKGLIMAGFGLIVLGEAAHRAIAGTLPSVGAMGAVGLAALAANALCLTLLWRHRSEDINMRSVWLCSRNDVIANLAVLGAAVAVWALGSRWPDLMVGVAIAALFLRSAMTVLRESFTELYRIA